MHPVGDTARLLNISSNGVLIETTARLLPGRRSTIVIVDASDKKVKVCGEIVRSQLVSISRHGELVYQTAMQFPEDLDVDLPLDDRGPTVAQALPRFTSRIEQPLQAEWVRSNGSTPATVTNLTETGCCIRTDAALTLDQFAVIRVHVAATRSLTLSGTVVAVDQEIGCLLRFEDLTAHTEQLLRTELLTLASQAPRDLASVFGLGTVRESESDEDIIVEWQSGGDASGPAA